MPNVIALKKFYQNLLTAIFFYRYLYYIHFERKKITLNSLLKTFFIIIILPAQLVLGQEMMQGSVQNEVALQQQDIPTANKIEIYPNPAIEYLIVEIYQSDLVNTEFELHSLIGNEVAVEPEEIGMNKFRFNVKELSTGYYFLVVKDEVTRYKKAYKFLKK